MLLLEKCKTLLERLNQLIIKTGALVRWYFRNLNNV